MVQRIRWVLALAIATALVVATATPPRSSGPAVHQAPLLPRLEFLRVVGAPFIHLITDYYWIRTINAVGSATNAAEYRDIYDYANMVTDLDPRFRQVYVFAGGIIPFNTGREWVNTQESTRLLEKGLKHFPDMVFLRILLAYNLTQFHNQPFRAAEVLADAARLPQAPPFVGPLAARLYAQAGNAEAAELLAGSLAASAADPETRETFELRRKEAQLERELQGIDRAVRAYYDREQHMPPDLQALVRAGDLPRIPDDPLGGELFLGPDGRSRSTAQGRRLSDIMVEEAPK